MDVTPNSAIPIRDDDQEISDGGGDHSLSDIDANLDAQAHDEEVFIQDTEKILGKLSIDELKIIQLLQTKTDVINLKKQNPFQRKQSINQMQMPKAQDLRSKFKKLNSENQDQFQRECVPESNDQNSQKICGGSQRYKILGQSFHSFAENEKD